MRQDSGRPYSGGLQHNDLSVASLRPNPVPSYKKGSRDGAVSELATDTREASGHTLLAATDLGV